jgi:membrane protease YdiL (CAAX protease family)
MAPRATNALTNGKNHANIPWCANGLHKGDENLATRTGPVRSSKAVAASCAFGALLLYFGERALLPDVRTQFDATMIILRESSLVAISILIAYAVMRLVPLRPSRLGLRTLGPETLLWGVVCMAACLLAGLLAATILLALHLSAQTSAFSLLSGRNFLLIAGYAGATAFCEELVFRGALFALFMALFDSRWIAAALSLVLFMLASVQSLNLAEFILVLVPGAVLTGFYLWKRDLAICMIGHAGARLAGMLIAQLMTRLG